MNIPQIHLAPVWYGRPIYRFLILGLRAQLTDDETEEFRSLFHRLGSQHCWDAANREHVLAAVSTRVVDVLGEEAPEVWRHHRDWNERRVRDLVEHLGEVCGYLDEKNVRSAAIEAGGVMLSSDLPYSAYGSSDIDLLVDTGSEQLVDHAMQKAGFRRMERAGRVETSRVEYFKERGEGWKLWLDAGPKVFERKWGRYEFSVDEDAWLTRRVRSPRSNDVWVLEPTDLMLQVALHTSTHTYLRAPGLRLHIDVDRMSRTGKVDWERLVREVSRVGGTARVWASLTFAQEILGTRVDQQAVVEVQVSLPGKLGAALLTQWASYVIRFSNRLVGSVWARGVEGVLILADSGKHSPSSRPG